MTNKVPHANDDTEKNAVQPESKPEIKSQKHKKEKKPFEPLNIPEFAYNFESLQKTTDDMIKERQKLYLETVQKFTKQKRLAIIIMVLLSPYFFVLRCLVYAFLLLIPPIGKKMALAYVKHFFKIFYAVRGVFFYSNTPLPKKPERPMIIIALKQSLLDSFFILKILKFPILIPLKESLRETKNKFWPPLPMSRFFQTLSYPDAELPNNMENIRGLIEKGYHVLIHPNKGFLNTELSGTVSIHQKILDVLEIDADIYFLNLDGMGRVPLASFRSPLVIFGTMVEKKQLFADVRPDDTLLQYKRIANFFGFTKFQVVD
ncbi:hypothetical protein ACFL96_01015 [Thermoproteota archaeon]